VGANSPTIRPASTTARIDRRIAPIPLASRSPQSL
jgi:hypothetical protein